MFSSPPTPQKKIIFLKKQRKNVLYVYWCYYTHWLRDSGSPVGWIFLYNLEPNSSYVMNTLNLTLW